jgi:hypothetical protein
MGLVRRPAARFDLAMRLRSPEGAPIGELFRFASGLYFRGKLLYAQAFAAPPRQVARALVIAPGRGLMSSEQKVGPADLDALAAVPVEPSDPRYRVPLETSAQALAAKLKSTDEVVLLGSIASGKYTEVLLDVFGERLLFPVAFVGRGDMSRGGLLLRAVASGAELDYAPVRGSVLRGQRPPRLGR